MSATPTHCAAQDHASRLAAGQACLHAALHSYLPLGFAVTCCCDPEHIGVEPKHAKHCNSPGKAPIQAWKALQTQLPTANEVRRWWHNYPIGNVGCVLGQASGLVRVDVDGAEGEALLAEWNAGDLPPTWTFRSSSAGRGLLYAWPRDLPCKSTAKASPGDHKELRLMGNGSQTILPPSRHSSGTLYTWEHGCSLDDLPIAPAPAWLRERLRAEPRPTPSHPTTLQEVPSPAIVSGALYTIPNDDAPYDTWLMLGQALQSLGQAWARGLWDSWSQQSAKYEAGQQQKSWASFSPDGTVQIDNLFALARKHGWKHPPTDARTGADMTATAAADARQRQNGYVAEVRGPRAVLVQAVTIQEEQVTFIWPLYIPRKMATILDGDPGVGKTGLACLVTASITRGYPMPDQDGKPTCTPEGPGNVLMVAMEDNLAAVIVPRLKQGGADLSRITFVNECVDAEGNPRPFTLTDIPLLAEYMERVRPKLVYIDAIQAVLGANADIHRANVVTALLAPLKKLAEQYDCAILCSRHPAKPGQNVAKVLYRGMGSQAFVGTVRSGLFIEEHPGDFTKSLLVHYKANAGRLGCTQIFSKAEGKFEWAGASRITHRSLAGDGSPGPLPQQKLKAALWLETRLGTTSVPASALLKEAEDLHDFSPKVLRAAAECIGVTKSQILGDFLWALPPLSHTPPITRASGVSGGTGETGGTGVDWPLQDESDFPTEMGEEGQSLSEASHDTPDTPDIQDHPVHPVLSTEARGVANLAPYDDAPPGGGGEQPAPGDVSDVSDVDEVYEVDGVVTDGTSASGTRTSNRVPGGGEACPQCHCTSLLVLGEYRKCPLCHWKGKAVQPGESEVSA
jgi:Bifunctional DNA primase/polymerase, N-terminal/AAA domain/Primase C terminal 2 (PriCT-2)